MDQKQIIESLRNLHACQRLQEYAPGLAEAFRMRDKEKDALRPAAILHDIDKIGIDDATLRKDDRLTAAAMSLSSVSLITNSLRLKALDV